MKELLKRIEIYPESVPYVVSKACLDFSNIPCISKEKVAKTKKRVDNVIILNHMYWQI